MYKFERALYLCIADLQQIRNLVVWPSGLRRWF